MLAPVSQQLAALSHCFALLCIGYGQVGKLSVLHMYIFLTRGLEHRYSM